MKSFEITLDTNLVCEVCGGSGNHMKIVDDKRKFFDCVCFGGCLY